MQIINFAYELSFNNLKNSNNKYVRIFFLNVDDVGKVNEINWLNVHKYASTIIVGILIRVRA